MDLKEIIITLKLAGSNTSYKFVSSMQCPLKNQPRDLICT